MLKWIADESFDGANALIRDILADWIDHQKPKRKRA